ncbi:RNA ligase (ATP) [Leptolyngbya sp. AN03gr2]|uniref:RNA ligase (ATP) n=1 Tax=unclassified Leptolyngbya TaxID=2650499 RepID=UPI003D3200FB
MSTFAVKIQRITIEDHPQATALQLARINDYRSCVKKGQYQTGDLAVYIPEQSVLPDPLIEQLDLSGKLGGKEANRVSAVRLRGIVSQGIVYPLTKCHNQWQLYVPEGCSDRSGIFSVSEGEDVTELLGITKFSPPIPPELKGKIFNAGIEACLKYDIENIKSHPNTLWEGEPVVMTEKVHGIWMQVAILPDDRVIVSSKELAHKGLAFELEGNDGNYYMEVVNQYQIAEKVKAIYPRRNTPYIILGEVFGRKIQDLGYGANTNQAEIGFRVFDVYLGERNRSRFLDDHELEAECQKLKLERVPVLYRGKFSNDILQYYTTGTETISGKGLHLREGVVVRPQIERETMELGRVILKSISDSYLLRKNGTEFR